MKVRCPCDCLLRGEATLRWFAFTKSREGEKLTGWNICSVLLLPCVVMHLEAFWDVSCEWLVLKYFACDHLVAHVTLPTVLNDELCKVHIGQKFSDTL